MSLVSRIDARTAKVSVVGLGYVGLALAVRLAEAGFHVVGVEKRRARATSIRAGKLPFSGREPGFSELLAQSITRGALTVVGELSAPEVASCDVVLLAVETPVERDHTPRYAALRSACESLGRVLRSGTLVVVESTVAPGTLDTLVRPWLERASGLSAERDFLLGHCPERVMPGKLLLNLRTMARVLGAHTEAAGQAMRALYRTVVEADLDVTDCLTAELVKTAENTYRDVNVAFANELALVCEASGGSFRRVRELVNKSPGRQVLEAGAGVGGHCITKDPWLLAHGAPEIDAQVISAARARNDDMPRHVLSLVASALGSVGRRLSGSRVAALGYAYLPECDDTRNSPSEVFVRLALAKGCEVRVHDPFVEAHTRPLEDVLDQADALVVLVAHEAYKRLDLDEVVARMRTKVLVDARGVVDRERAQRAGLVWRGLGEGAPRSK